MSSSEYIFISILDILQKIELHKRIFPNKYTIKTIYSHICIFLMVGTCFSCQNTPISISIMTIMIGFERNRNFVESQALKNGRVQNPPDYIVFCYLVLVYILTKTQKLGRIDRG